MIVKNGSESPGLGGVRGRLLIRRSWVTPRAQRALGVSSTAIPTPVIAVPPVYRERMTDADDLNDADYEKRQLASLETTE